LKPDCLTRPTEVGGDRHTARSKGAVLNTCENDQAKPDLFSRLACST